MEAKEVILKALQEAYDRKDLTEEDITDRDEVVFEAGIQEVVEWIRRNSSDILTKVGLFRVMELSDEWQAFFKEKGIK